MLCGYLKKTCKSITVQQLIDILSLCKNKNAIVKMSDMTNFFIHFDADGQFINISKSYDNNRYGDSGQDNSCLKCPRHNNRTNECQCDGKNCLNASSIVDTEKFDKLPSTENEVYNDSKAEASTTVIQNDKYNLNNFTVNGAGNKQEESDNTVKVQENISIESNNSTKIENKQEWVSLEKMINNAFIKALDKMINSLKG